MPTSSLRLAVALDGAGWHPAARRAEGARPGELFTPRYRTDLVHEAERGLVDFVTIDDSLALHSARRGVPGDRLDQVRGRLGAAFVAGKDAEPGAPINRQHKRRMIPQCGVANPNFACDLDFVRPRKDSNLRTRFRNLLGSVHRDRASRVLAVQDWLRIPRDSQAPGLVKSICRGASAWAGRSSRLRVERWFRLFACDTHTKGSRGKHGSRAEIATADTRSSVTSPEPLALTGCLS